MKKIYTIATILLLTFTACSNKESLFNEDKLYKSALIHSKSGEIYNSLELKASIIATQLNSFLDECKSCGYDRFLVAIYIDNDSSNPKKQGYYNSYYHLTLNGKEPVNVKELDYDDDLIKLAPFRNRWAHYYVMDFNKTIGKEMKMRYESKGYGGVTLTFPTDY